MFHKFTPKTKGALGVITNPAYATLRARYGGASSYLIKSPPNFPASISFCGNGAIPEVGDFFVGHGSAGIAFVLNRGPGALELGTNSHTIMTFNNDGSVTMGGVAPSNQALIVNGTAGNYTLLVAAGGSTSTAFGLLVEAGTNTTDNAVLVNNKGNTVNYFQIRGDGAIRANGPNAATLVDMTPDTGTFTGTLTGFASLTTSCAWSRNGNQVTLWINQATGTSNATTMTMTGLPAAIKPTRLIEGCCIVENSGAMLMSVYNISAGGTTLSFSNGLTVNTDFTASGTKGIPSNLCISYQLN